MAQVTGTTDSYDLVGVAEDRRIGNVALVGNTGAASIPLALGDACRDGSLRAGHRLLATSFGGGLTWGATTLVWPDVTADFGVLGEDR